ncbi:MAG: hypothetical protein AB7P07_11995 [Hyphomonadaceae bacterium]
MDVSLDAVVLRRVAENAERSAEQRALRRREEMARAAVDHGEARSQQEAPKEPLLIEPAAVFDKLREQDAGHLIDIIV